MNPGTTFDSTKQSLQDLLKEIKSGKIQLPDFQRGWIWDDNHVKSLLASISVAYPIGAIMLYETGNPDVRFMPRPVEGVKLGDDGKPEWLILDGQQRLTSLFQALYVSSPVKTQDARGNLIERWYYLHIPIALDQNADQEEAILSLPADRKFRNFRGEVIADYSTTELECAHQMFPLPLVFDTVGLTNWQMKFLDVPSEKIRDRLQVWNGLVQNIVQRFQQYQIPLIKMFKATPKEAVCQVFERVNTGGVSLTVFELLTATFAADEGDFKLRQDWENRAKEIRKYKVLRTVQSDDLLQAISLLSSRERRLAALNQGIQSDKAPGVTCKRKDLLRLTLSDYRTWADDVTAGFLRAAKFMHSQRIFDARDLPYRTQLVPLSAILTLLGDKADHDGVKQRIARWFWCGVFGELYGGAIETRFAKDVPEVIAWLNGGPEPSTITDANFAPRRLHGLRTRNSAAYKGLYALLIKDGGLDFRSGEEISLQMYFDDKIDIHHIFPQDYCRAKKIDPKLCDSAINKTAISAKTNRIIGGNAPSSYLEKIKKQAGIDDNRMKQILSTHVIDPDLLKSDDFDKFFRRREEALLERIERAMGKPIAREAVQQEKEKEVVDFETEENEIS
ncbi:MAG: DUF262 domain-containing protein [Desulfobacteraceae bacterium]|nr:MAG: DUF262 domain-containing protein [Desulfobacteraceae bacterium]